MRIVTKKRSTNKRKKEKNWKNPVHLRPISYHRTQKRKNWDSGWTWIRMRRSELWRLSKRRSEKPLRASWICWSSSGVPSSGWNSHTWRPKWLFRVFTQLSLPPLSSPLSPLTVSAPIFSFHIPHFLWITFHGKNPRKISKERERERWAWQLTIESKNCRQPVFPPFFAQFHSHNYVGEHGSFISSFFFIDMKFQSQLSIKKNCNYTYHFDIKSLISQLVNTFTGSLNETFMI